MLILFAVLSAAFFGNSQAQEATCTGPVQERSSVWGCGIGKILDCPGPGCPAEAVLMIEVEYRDDAAVQLPSGFLGKGRCEEIASIARAGDVGIVARIGRIQDDLLASSIGAQASLYVAKQVAEKCRIDAGRIMPIGVSGGDFDIVGDVAVADYVTIAPASAILKPGSEVKTLRELMM